MAALSLYLLGTAALPRTARAVQRKRGSCTEARSGRTPTGRRYRLATATESAGSQLFLKVAIALLPRLEKRPLTGKVVSNKNRMKNACTRGLVPGRPGSVVRISTRSPRVAAHSGSRHHSIHTSTNERQLCDRQVAQQQEGRGAHPVLPGLAQRQDDIPEDRTVRWGGTGLRAFPCPGTHHASRWGAQILG